MIGTEREDTFVRQHRWAAITTLRKHGTPSTSLVAYAADGDDIVISVTEDRLKVRTIDRDPRVSVCVISNHEPFNYVTIEGNATIERENVRPATELVMNSLEAINYPQPPDLDEWIRQQRRVIIRVQPGQVHSVIRERS
jgi:PPOX class probable F420-dependent enzyme